jgi:hypothetical protein
VCSSQLVSSDMMLELFQYSALGAKDQAEFKSSFRLNATPRKGAFCELNSIPFLSSACFPLPVEPYRVTCTPGLFRLRTQRSTR